MFIKSVNDEFVHKSKPVQILENVIFISRVFITLFLSPWFSYIRAQDYGNSWVEYLPTLRIVNHWFSCIVDDCFLPFPGALSTFVQTLQRTKAGILISSTNKITVSFLPASLPFPFTFRFYEARNTFGWTNLTRTTSISELSSPS